MNVSLQKDEAWFKKQVPWFSGDYLDSNPKWRAHNHELRIKEERLLRHREWLNSVGARFAGWCDG